MDRNHDVEKELGRLLTEGELEKQDARLEAIKRLPPRWVAIYPSSFHQVNEETKLLRKFLKVESNEEEKARSEND